MIQNHILQYIPQSFYNKTVINQNRLSNKFDFFVFCFMMFVGCDFGGSKYVLTSKMPVIIIENEFSKKSTPYIIFIMM